MYVERLERLEQALRVYATNEIYRAERAMLLHDGSQCDFIFNLAVWCTRTEYYSGQERHCGTTGCAIGLAMQQGLFEKEGLRNTVFGPALVGDGYFHGFEAIQRLFGLDQVKVRYLFSHSGRVSVYGPRAALECANRIRELIDSAVQQPKKTKKKCAERELELA